MLGVNVRSLDSETRERRLMLFWMLNGLDKSLALISGRSPTFVRAMFSKVPTIELQKMLVYQPHMSGEEEGVTWICFPFILSELFQVF